MTFDPVETLIWSADIPYDHPAGAYNALAANLQLMPEGSLVKLDRLFVEGMGIEVVRRVHRDFGVRVFDDAKIAEIPVKAQALAELHLHNQPWMLNCMATITSTGLMGKDIPLDRRDGLKRFADACLRAGTRPCAVTVLTSKSEGLVETEFNGRTPVDQVLTYMDLILEAGFTDVVCSPQEAAAIRADSGFDDLALNCPGIRPAGSDAGDQARTDTPAGALLAGVNRLVIGRPLTVGDFAVNYTRIADEIRSVGAHERTSEQLV